MDYKMPKKLEYTRTLLGEKQKLLEQLKNISEEIKKNTEDCDHISVELGTMEAEEYKFRCLLCGKKLSKPTTSCVHIRKYLRNHSHCITESEMLESVQTIAFAFLQSDISISQEELVNKLNSILDIDQEMDFSKGKNLTKIK